MTTEGPITRQLDALAAWSDDGEPLMDGWRGEQWVMIHEKGLSYRPVRKRVWERLLERGDLEIRVIDRGPSVRRRRQLYITEQGRARLIGASRG